MESNEDVSNPGRIYNAENISVWVYRWADLFADARERYEFFRDKLGVEASTGEGMASWNERFGHLLTGGGVRKRRDQEVSAAKARRQPPKINVA